MVTKLIRRVHESYENDYYGPSCPLNKMASVGSRGVRSLSLGQRVFTAFREWYVYACGYRQIGVLILHVLLYYIVKITYGNYVKCCIKFHLNFT